MARAMASDAPKAGLSIQGKARDDARPSLPSTSRPGKRDRRKRRGTAKSSDNIDLTAEDGADQRSGSSRGDRSCISFTGVDELACPGAGPSKLRSPIPSYTPTSFTPISRSILAGLSRRPSPSPRPRSLSSTEARVQCGDVAVEEQPDPTSRAPSPRRSPAQAPQASSEHFEPPDLFSTSLMPSIDCTSGQVDLHKPIENGKSDGSAAEEDKLLLPSHVLLDSVSPHADLIVRGREEVDADSREGDSYMEGLHFLDDDVSKGVARYFDPSSPPRTAEATFLAIADQSKICQNCKRPGHRMKDCPHTICALDAGKEGIDRPFVVTLDPLDNAEFRAWQECPDPKSRVLRRQGCDRCGSRDHLDNSCPSLWRIYSYRSQEDRRAVQDEKASAEGWTQEAIGGGVEEEWCYNCAEEGHLGDDCQQRRRSLARLFVPSAFSIAMSTLGPYADAGPSRSTAPATHARWNDDGELPYMTPGFEGAMAGRKSRDKAKRRMMESDRRGQDDEEDWFGGSQRKNGISIRGRGSGRGTPIQRRPWPSDHGPGLKSNPSSQRDHLPFSHSHLMSPAPASAPAKGIAFGKLTLPVDSPTIGKGRKPANPALAMVNRITSSASASRNASQPNASSGSPTPGSSRSKKRRKRCEEHGRDWEGEWRASGQGGGPVMGWGKDINWEERKVKKEAAKVAGQRYTGGY